MLLNAPPDWSWSTDETLLARMEQKIIERIDALFVPKRTILQAYGNETSRVDNGF